MKFKSVVFWCLLGFFILSGNLYAQQVQTHGYTIPINRPSAPNNFFDKPDEYLNWQAQNILDIVEEISVRFPPQLTEPLERRAALLMLDAVFHDVKAPERSAVQEFHQDRIEKAIKEMESKHVDKGAIIWKLYDMAFVVRTNTVTIGFDLTRGHSARAEGFGISNILYKRIISQCDALFISHRHGDHADEWVAQEFIDQGKPVVAPEGIWANKPIYKKMTHLQRKANQMQSLPIQFGKRELKVVIYPGHQGAAILNNVSLVITPEDLSFCHTGDQSSNDDLEWIDKVGEHFWIDVFMPNCWTTDPPRATRGYNPELILPGHENELGHSIDHREAYGLDYSRWLVPKAKIIMFWGESYHYLPRAK
jgi:hypothetical protein